MTAAETPSRLSAGERIRRLNTASLRRVIEPDTEVAGTLSKIQVLPDDLLSVVGLDL